MITAQCRRTLVYQQRDDAHANLGLVYAEERGVAQDDQEAVRWLRRAAEQRHTVGQIFLATMYADGRGIAQDYIYAHMWYDLTVANAENGSIRAFSKKRRDRVAGLMTSAQIAEAQRRARECIGKEFKGC